MVADELCLGTALLGSLLDGGTALDESYRHVVDIQKSDPVWVAFFYIERKDYEIYYIRSRTSGL